VTVIGAVGGGAVLAIFLRPPVYSPPIQLDWLSAFLVTS
jgi:hypothetical protein